MNVYTSTNIKTLTQFFIKDVLSKENFNPGNKKSSFLTGGTVIVCESKGLQEYIEKTCVDQYGIWTALPFKPLAGILMQCAYYLLKERKKDERENVFNHPNLVWAIYRLLEGDQKTYYFANELASLFFNYQIYRPEIIEKWNNGEAYSALNADKNFIDNEKFQRNLWEKIIQENKNELDISGIYKYLEAKLREDKCDKSSLPGQIYFFAPVSICPVHLSALTSLSMAGSKVNLYLFQISREYIGEHLSNKQIASLRKKSWKKNKIVNETQLYWDLGNRLIANLGRTAQIFYEQLLEYEEAGKIQIHELNDGIKAGKSTLLSKIQSNIINDDDTETECTIDDSILFSSCYSPLREVEVLSDYILDLFKNKCDLTPADIAVVSPNIENYAGAIDTIFGRYEIPYKITDHGEKNYDKTVHLLKILFSVIDSRYESADLIALFEYSKFIQEKELDSKEMEHLVKWIRENAIRYGLDSINEKPDYSVESGLDQLAAGFFMISENGFSGNGDNEDYCYPDIEGNMVNILGDFSCFINTLRDFKKASADEKTINGWDSFLREKLQIFFGTDETDFNEESDNPYHKIISIWDQLKNEMLTGFGSRDEITVNFSLLKTALLKKSETKAYASNIMDGKISFSGFDSIRGIPYKVICCIGMNNKDFPQHTEKREIDLMQDYIQGDKDITSENRLMFLEIICNAEEKLYISWIGQDEKTSGELKPSSVVTMLLENLHKQYLMKSNSAELVVRYPLMPFSSKYTSGILGTYDNRWINRENLLNSDSGNIWKWRIKHGNNELNRNTATLYKILTDAPKYFIKNICGIELPEEFILPENKEPFIVEKGLDEWSLSDLILKNILKDKDVYDNIKISKYRGELPTGDFADKIIENKIMTINNMIKIKKNLEIEDPNVNIFIKSGRTKGKYRLWHWLKHLEINSSLMENSASYIILLDKKRNPVKIKLNGLSAKTAEYEIDRLWSLSDQLSEKMLPIFPDAAWDYIINGNNINEANKTIFGDYTSGGIAEYSQYAKVLLSNIKSLSDIKADYNILEIFCKCSMDLFGTYCDLREE